MGNIEGNVNCCTYTFVAGRSTSKLYCKSSEQNKTAKAKKHQRDDISIRALFGLARPKLHFNSNILFKAIAQHGIDGGLIGAILL